MSRLFLSRLFLTTFSEHADGERRGLVRIRLQHRKGLGKMCLQVPSDWHRASALAVGMLRKVVKNRYCSSYSQDMHLCCPVACDQCPSGPPPPAATPPPQPAATRTPTRAPTGAPTSPASTHTPTRSPTAPPVSSPSSGCVNGDPQFINQFVHRFMDRFVNRCVDGDPRVQLNGRYAC